MEALNKSASYRCGEAVAELTLVGIAVSEAGKPRCGFSLPARREDKGELIDRA